MATHLNDAELERLTPSQRTTYVSGDDLAKGAWAQEYRAIWERGEVVEDGPLHYWPHWIIVAGVAAMVIALFALPSSAPNSDVVNLDRMSFKLMVFLSGMTAVISGSVFATRNRKPN